VTRKEVLANDLAGVWSASPTPFTDKMRIDTVAVRRMIDHHLKLDVDKLFLAGTCGEGPWMPDRDRRRLVQTAAEYAAEKGVLLAVQVTDNSAARILDNVHEAKEDGADIAVIAPPHFLVSPTPKRILDLYLQAIRQSPLPIGIYDRGRAASVVVPDSVMRRLCAEPNVVLIKDSSCDPGRRDLFLKARRQNPGLCVLCGYEFGCPEYIRAGYDGLLLGGGIFNGFMARQIIDAVAAGDLAAAEKIQQRMSRINFAVYGGKGIKCWLTGLKTLLVAMGVFRTVRGHLPYQVTESCRRAIDRILEKDRDVLMPWMAT